MKIFGYLYDNIYFITNKSYKGNIHEFWSFMFECANHFIISSFSSVISWHATLFLFGYCVWTFQYIESSIQQFTRATPVQIVHCTYCIFQTFWNGNLYMNTFQINLRFLFQKVWKIQATVSPEERAKYLENCTHPCIWCSWRTDRSMYYAIICHNPY